MQAAAGGVLVPLDVWQAVLTYVVESQADGRRVRTLCTHE